MAEYKGLLGDRLLKLLAIIAMLGVVITAVVVKGFEQGEVKLNTQNLWVLHKEKIDSSHYYGQLNTGLAELTSVNSLSKMPGSILQSAHGAVLLGENNVSVASINLAAPADYAAESQEFVATIDSDSVAISENVIVYFGKKLGTVSYSKILKGKASAPIAIRKPAELGEEGFSSASVTTQGVIQAFSADAGKVFYFDTVRGEWAGDSDEVSGATASEYQMTSVGDSWLLIDTKLGKSWVRGVPNGNPIGDLADMKIQSPSGPGDLAFFSTANSLFSVSLDSGALKTVARSAGGVNSAPVIFEENVYAGWLNESSGEIYNGATGDLLPLAGFGAGKSLGGRQEAVIQSNGSAAVLNDAQSGWAWNINDGSVIPSSQDWKSKITPPPPATTGGEKAKKPEPPVANDDSFGARPDALTNLPVLLNDTDPNPDDVLTIDPDSVTGWDNSKGTLRIASDGQSFSLLAKETITGTASFSYKVSDGSQAKGLLSKSSATVTVAFVTGTRNTSPVWCSNAPTPCLERTEPTASVLPGQSVSVAFADGFVDPEGDKVFIISTELTSGTGNVGFTSKGEVVFRSSLSKGAREVAKVNVTVSDSRGATTTKSLTIKVDPNAQLYFEPFVVSAMVGQPKVIDVRRGAFAVNGQLNLLEVKAPVSADGVAVEIVSPTSFSVTSPRAEQIQVSIKFTDDSGAPKSSFVQVNVVEDAKASIAVSPVTVLVRAGLDSTVDLYTAISNSSERALIISDIRIERAPGSVLSAGKVKGGNLRIRGETETRAAGRVGTIRYRVSDGSSDTAFTSEGQIFVYQIASPTTVPVGVDDSITLRAETTGDLDALSNDVGTPGIPLVLDAKNVSCEGTGFDENQGIAFAAHGVLRIVAPNVRGIYNCTYYFYSSDSPAQKSSANFTVNVTSKSSNRPPIPTTVKARVTSYATVEIPIPLGGIDPDGDTVSITSVGLTAAGKGYAAIGAKGNSVLFTVVPGEVGQDSFTYTVSDGNQENGEATGVVKVGIFANPTNDGPVTMVDVVNLVAGSDGYAKFDPTANDFDSAGKGLKLVPGSLKPNLKEGTAAFDKAAALIDAPVNAEDRLVTIRAAAEVSDIEYKYSVKDGFGSESIGTIIVHVNLKPVPDNPEVQDTIVDASQRATLATTGVDVVSNKVTWLTGDPSSLKLTIVGNPRGFRVQGSNFLVGAPPTTATFVVFKLAGKNYANQDALTYGILHIPAESKVINLKDVTKVWTVKEGETGEENLLDWIAVLAGSSIEIDGESVSTSPNGRPEGKCSFKSGTTVSYSAGNGGTKFNDVCLVPVRYVGEPTYTVVPLRIRIIADKPQPVFTNVTVEVMPGSRAELNLKNMVAWDSENPSFDWKVARSSGTSIVFTGPNSDLMTFEVVQGAESGQQDVFKIRIGDFESFGVVTVIVGESPNAKPSATLTFDNAKCEVKKGTCSLQIGNLTGVVNAFPEPLKFMPIGYSQGAPNYKTGQVLKCLGITIKVVDANTVTASWDVKKGTPKTQSCPTQDAPGALLDAEGKKGVLKIAVDLQGVPGAPLSVEQVDFGRSTVTIRIKAGDDTVGENAVTRYVVREGGREVITCDREGDELITTCKPIEDLRPYRGTGDTENLHTYSVTAENRIGESAAKLGSGIYAYENLKKITPDVIEAQTVLGRETSATMGVLRVTLTPRADPLAAKYIVSGEGGSTVKTIPINGDYKARIFEISAKPGLATSVTVRAEGAIPPPVKNGLVENSSTSWIGRVSGTPIVGKASVSVLGETAPYFGKVSLENANRNYSIRVSKVAYVLWPGASGPACTFDEATNTLTVGSVPGALVKFAEDRAFNDQVSDLTSPDIPGLQQNVSYRAKVCYSNGFKLVEAIAPNVVSTIADPLDGDFEYTVALASSTQASTGPIFSWVVKEAKKPVIPAGLKVQYSGDPSKPNEWKDDIYSTVWGAKPVIKVRYCNTSGSICSAGQTLVKPQAEGKSWQLRIERAYLATPDENASETTACLARPVDLNFGVSGDGVSGWIGGKSESIETGAFKAEYQLTGSSSWVEMDDARTYFRILRGVGRISKIRFWFQPNSGTTKELERVQVTLDVTC